MRVPPAPPVFDLSGPAGDAGMSARVFRVLNAPVGPTIGGRYLHWDELRHRDPPVGLSVEEHWHAVAIARRRLREPIPLIGVRGGEFSYAPVPALSALLHDIDRQAGGLVQAPEAILNAATRDRYLLASLREEAITSSQLEGASTARAAAQHMLREQRAPRDTSERMILNNYRAMEWLHELGPEQLSPGLVRELHSIVTDGTLADPGDAGRFRRDADDIVVSDEIGTVLHRPPSAIALDRRVAVMCDFANGWQRPERFVHPAVRAMTLHFWLAYDHPFVDGNGRVARALFYWAMARQGYWLAEFVPISRILRRARGQYVRSFLYSETDQNDLTYFLFHQARVLLRGLADLREYIARKEAREEATSRVLARRSTGRNLNERQLALLTHAIAHADARYTVETHRTSQGVSYETARQDLMDLEERRFLDRIKHGRKFVWTPGASLKKLPAATQHAPAR